MRRMWPRRQPGRPADDAGDGAAEEVHVLDWRHAEGGAVERALGPLAWDGPVGELLDFCAVQGGRSQRDWQMRAAVLRQAAPFSDEALRLVAVREELAPEARHFLVNVVKALALRGEDAVPVLVRVADQHGRARLPGHHEAVARVAVRMLGTVGGEQVLSPLRRIKAHSPLASLRKAAGVELDRVLRSTGPVRDDVPEWRAETFELNADGARRVPLSGGYAADVRLRPGGKVSVEYRGPDGALLAARPTGPRARQGQGQQAVTDLVRGIRGVVRAEKARLTELMTDGRQLDPELWAGHYLDHPLTGQLARTLVWEVSADDGVTWWRGVPARGGPDGEWRLRTLDDQRRAVPADAVLRLMRPIRATSRAGHAWTTRLQRWELPQAVGQFE